jgi:transposase
MRDTQLYQQILGLAEPWFVERVELDMENQRVDVFVKHRSDVQWECPVCSKSCGLYDHAEERTWRHLDSCQLKTFLHARPPRSGCAEHGIHKVKLPWAETRSRFTLLMERMVIDVIKQCSTISGACAIMRISWDEAFNIMERSVDRGLERKSQKVIEHIGVDEKAFRKGHSYMTIVCDLDQATVEHVSEDRTAASLAGYFDSLNEDQRCGIMAVAMDMWEPYVQATTAALPLAKSRIVFDRFHIIKQMNQAVDKVRLGEHRSMSETGRSLLKGTKHLWLYGRENLPDKHRSAFAELKNSNLQTARAWAIKETLRDLWSYRSITWARRFFISWFGWAKRSRLPPVKKVADTIKSHLEQVLNYCNHPITNGVAEGINSKIMSIKRKCCGFANKENFKTAIYFHCGGLDLYPR